MNEDDLRAERILLMLRVTHPGDDVYDIAAWRVDGRSLTDHELALLDGMTVEEVVDAKELAALDTELKGNGPEWGEQP